MARGTGKTITIRRDDGTVDGSSDNTERSNSAPGSERPDTLGYLDPASIDAADSGSGSGSDAGEPVRTGKKRGPKPGSKRTGAAKKTTPNLNLTGALYLVHFSIAQLLHDPVWALTEDEAKQYADSVQALIVFYGMDSIPAEVAVWTQFLTCAGVIYGKRIVQKMMTPKVVPIDAPTE